MRSLKKVFLTVLAVLCLFPATCFAGRIDYPENLWEGIMGEAVSEGPKGMYAVTCVYRNRLEKNLPLGCVALKRKDLDRFVKNQGKKYEKMAKEIVRMVFIENAADVTGGATHYENIKAFGTPLWSRTMKRVAKLGNHTFFK